MKKQYGTPEAEKLEFDYKDAIVASAVRGKNLPLRALSTQRQGWTQAAPFPPRQRGGGRLRHGDRDADSRWFSSHEMEPPHPERAYGDARHRREAKY